MDKQAENILRSQYKKIPGQLRKALTSVDLREKLRVVAQKHNIRPDEALGLENEVAMVLFGLEHPSDFPENVKEHVKLPENRVFMIVRDVNDQIFSPVRSALRILQSGGQNTQTRHQYTNEERMTRMEEHGTNTRMEANDANGEKEEELRGVERSMPRDVAAIQRREQTSIPKQEQKKDGGSKNTIPDENKAFFTKNTYNGGDPYREPLE